MIVQIYVKNFLAKDFSVMVGKFAECANADALRRAAEWRQSMIDAQRAEVEQSKEREAEDRRKASLPALCP